jgi:tRNA splicing ligase
MFECVKSIISDSLRDIKVFLAMLYKIDCHKGRNIKGLTIDI